jgi:hypothetical protein
MGKIDASTSRPCARAHNNQSTPLLIPVRALIACCRRHTARGHPLSAGDRVRYEIRSPYRLHAGGPP